MYSYPYETTKAALLSLRESEPCDPYDGWKVRYINPQTGGHAMTTMAAYLQLLPDGMTTAPYRATDGAVFVVVEGRGRTTVGSTVLEWEPHDVFVVPSWHWFRHEVEGETVLFSYSDRSAQEKLGLWFEERGNNPA
jgi:gentisate 1,2-dioxygenase